MNSLENKQHFSLRKLSVGLAGVMIGLSFFSAENKIVKADTIGDDNSANIETVNQKASTKTEAQTDSGIQNNSNTQANSQVDKTRVNSGQTSVSTGEPNKNNVANDPAIQNNPDKTNTVDANPKTANSNVNTEAKQHTQSLLKANLNTVTTKTKALNKNMINSNALSESKVETATPDYTPAIDAWAGSVDSQGYYELTGYDASKDSNLQNNGIFSIPNAADFEKAGKSTNSHQVGITRDGIHAIFKANSNKIKDLHFSDTDNQKIKAIGSNWTYAFSLYNGSDGYKSSNIQKVTGNGFDTSNITDMSDMFYSNQISDLTPFSNWKVDNVTDISAMFSSNKISDLTPLTNWKVDNVTNIASMFAFNKISNLTPLTN